MTRNGHHFYEIRIRGGFSSLCAVRVHWGLRGEERTTVDSEAKPRMRYLLYRHGHVTGQSSRFYLAKIEHHWHKQRPPRRRGGRALPPLYCKIWSLWEYFAVRILLLVLYFMVRIFCIHLGLKESLSHGLGGANCLSERLP